MGYCKCNSSGEETSDPETCAEIGCVYTDEKPGGGCFLGDLLNYYAHENLGADALALLSIGPAFAALNDFRNVILAHTAVGRQMIAYHDRFNQDALLLAKANPDIFRRTLRTCLLTFTFSRAMLRCHFTGRDDGRHFTQRMFETAVRLINEFESKSGDPELKRALHELEAEVERYVGLTPSEALKVLRREQTPPGS
jgi:hypothetical protein